MPPLPPVHLLIALPAPQVDLANKTQEFVELYHSIIPDKDLKERVPVLVHGPKRLVDPTVIVVRVPSALPHTAGAHQHW